MRDRIMEIITTAATTAGVQADRVFDVSAADNLTLPRPRVEVNFLPGSYSRTGRKLAVTRAQSVQTTKKELYEARVDLTAQVYADNAAWLAAFENDFVVAFPRGFNDARGNWVKILVREATFRKEPTKRVGVKEIKVFTKLDTLFALSFTGRVTQEEEEQLITTVDIQAPKVGL